MSARPAPEAMLIVAAVLHLVFGPIQAAFCEMTDAEVVKQIAKKPAQTVPAAKKKSAAKKKTASKKKKS